MLKPEAAKSQLETWRVPEGAERLTAAVAKLAGPLRSVAYGLLGRDDQGEPFTYWNGDDCQKRLLEAGRRLDQLPRKDRLKIFGTAAPRLAEALDTAWEFLRRTPYQQGHTRKAFRAPNHPEATVESRADWLSELLGLAEHFREDVPTAPWLAAWAPHLESLPGGGGAGDNIGRLLAAVIDAGGPEGDEVFEILCQSVRNEHPIGGMGRHVTRGLLLAGRPEGWELIEKTLLAAQRQEGLRQAILEAVDEAHPDAFRRMLRLIRAHDLARFSAVVRAVDVWFGYGWDAVSVKVVNGTIDRLLTLLDDPDARRQALAGGDAEAVYLALWATAFEDAVAALPLAEKLLGHADVAVRFATAVLLGRLGLPQAQAALLPALEDEDLRVAVAALTGIRDQKEGTSSDIAGEGDLFERLERLFERLPAKPAVLKPLVWPWAGQRAERQEAAGALLGALGKRPATRLIPYLKAFDPWHRRAVAEELAKAKKWDGLTRDTLFVLAGDASDYVREAAFEALAKTSLQPGEAERLESYLTRKAGDLRCDAVALLVGQPDRAALASADRLLGAKDRNQRLAGLEVLRQLSEAGRVGDECRGRAEAYRAGRGKLTREEQTQLDAIACSGREAVTLDNALGLMNPAERSPVIAPVKRKVAFITPAAVACLQSLDDLIHQHRDTPVVIRSGYHPEERPLGTLDWQFPSPRFFRPRDQEAARLPLRPLWLEWSARRPRDLRDRDGLELVRAAAWVGLSDEEDAERWRQWAQKSPARKAAAEAVAGGQAPVKLRYQRIVAEVLDWLLYLAPPDAVDYLLDAVEMSFALVPPEEMKRLGERPEMPASLVIPGFFVHDNDWDWRSAEVFRLWLNAFSRHLARSGAALRPPQAERCWQLLHWLDEPFPGAPRSRPGWAVVAAAYAAGGANLADLTDEFLGPRPPDPWGRLSFDSLTELTQRKLSKENEEFCARYPEVRDLVERCRARILEIELARGEAPTVATPAAHTLRSLWGTDTLLRILDALGKTGAAGSGRRSTLSHLARITFPKPEDTLEDFTRRARRAVAEGQFPEECLSQLSFLAPQWVRFVEHFLGWAGYTEAVYWFLAHMSVWGATELAAGGAGIEDEETTASEEPDEGEGAAGRREKLSAWDRLILERTPLSDAQRQAGAIDVAWFRRTYEQLGAKRWQAVADAARFVHGSDARKARFLADVLLGKAGRRELLDGVKKKRLKEYVRLLGLLPLAGGARRDADLAERFRVLQDYRRYAGQLSSMSKPDALRAAEVGLQNLAATAGYPDPLRLEWAMGAEGVKDLAAGPVSVTKDGVTVTLALEEGSQPQLTVRRGDKELKTIPPPVKKDKKVAALVERCTDLHRQAAQMRQSLEAAMCRGDLFTGAELVQLCGHALLAPSLERLVLIGDGILGYPDRQGRALRDHRGKRTPVKPGDQLRIAHPYDLLRTGAWDQWQHECFRAERLQPFKQVFRELYVLTRQEKHDGTVSRRYAGQQVQEKQAYALWGRRGWNTRDGVFKTFHDLGLTATVSFNYGVTTPLEVEGLTIEGVSFSRRDEWRPMKLTEVPPRVFSEVMRDLDLVVSVAHAGGVDPEASASTVEMRADLLRETCTLLRLANVRLKNAHAVIDGQLAQYSVHLGSGTVHRLPGGALCVVPVHAQHRGRLFLPFADDDPKTAEVLAKVLLLARDAEIQDPTILEQIRR